MIHVAILDDDIFFARNISHYVEKTINDKKINEISIFTYAEKFIESIAHDKILIDIAILDIRLSESVDGITVACLINELQPNCQIIFLTGFLEYATRAYDAQHVYYVLKSEFEERLHLALAQSLKNINKTDQDILTLISKDKDVRIHFRKIIYIERNLRITNLYYENQMYSFSDKLDDFMNRIPSPPFCRCHNSFIVNLDYIQIFEKTQFFMAKGIVVPISRNYYQEVKRLYTKYIIG